jgi:uracil-DNA glycosylase family 4
MHRMHSVHVKVKLAHPRTGVLFDSPVPQGAAWPGEVASSATAVATTPSQVVRLAGAVTTVEQLDAEVSVCRACPRLVAWREEVAVVKRKSYADQPYWGRPIPGWGSPRPRVMIVGLAPAAHGGNRTGRVFTGDRSGDFLFAALYRAGLANQSVCVDAADGLALNDTRIVAAVRCAPPANAPTPGERAACAPWLDAEWRLVHASVRVIVALGGFAWRAALEIVRNRGGVVGSPVPRFGHGAVAELGEVTLIGCYHPSQQNTFTGRLTPRMLDEVFTTAKRFVGDE